MSHYWPTHSWIRGILSPAAVAVGLVATTATAWADGGDKHLGVQMRPIPLGVSGSSIEFIESKGRLFCYAGTLGTLVVDAFGEQYILSNNHVLAKEGQSLLGEEIIQPGLLDEGSCTLSSGNPGNVVAHLTDYEPLRFGKGKNKPVNTIDAAIAATVAGAVDDDGQILDIGTISGAPAAAALNMAVQKSGRTTGHTFGFILATSVDIDVKYDGGKWLACPPGRSGG